MADFSKITNLPTLYVFDHRKKCFNCTKLRLTGLCGCCQERVCRECAGTPTKNEPPEIACTACREESDSYWSGP